VQAAIPGGREHATAANRPPWVARSGDLPRPALGSKRKGLNGPTKPRGSRLMAPTKLAAPSATRLRAVTQGPHEMRTPLGLDRPVRFGRPASTARCAQKRATPSGEAAVAAGAPPRRRPPGAGAPYGIRGMPVAPGVIPPNRPDGRAPERGVVLGALGDRRRTPPWCGWAKPAGTCGSGSVCGSPRERTKGAAFRHRGGQVCSAFDGAASSRLMVPAPPRRVFW